VPSDWLCTLSPSGPNGGGQVTAKPKGNVYNAEAVTCRLPREHNPAQKVERVGYWHGETRVGRTRLTTD
jgi:hypothetical protein